MKLKHKIALFSIYFIIFFVGAALINYYAYLTLDSTFLIAGSILLALLATWQHNRYHVKTKADELAEKIEKIL